MAEPIHDAPSRSASCSSRTTEGDGASRSTVPESHAPGVLQVQQSVQSDLVQEGDLGQVEQQPGTGWRLAARAWMMRRSRSSAVRASIEPRSATSVTPTGSSATSMVRDGGSQSASVAGGLADVLSCLAISLPSGAGPGGRRDAPGLVANSPSG